MKKLEVVGGIASELVGRDWVSSTSVKDEVDYEKDGATHQHIRVIVFYNGQIHTKDQYLDACAKVLSDPFFDSLDIKFDRIFYDTCIYLHHIDVKKNILDIILSLPYSFKIPEKEKLYSEIAGCNMKVKQDEMLYTSFACELGG